MGPSLMPVCLRLVVADRSGALALGSPWHLARLGTWHLFVVTAAYSRGVCLRVSSSRCVCSLRVLAVLVLLSLCVGRSGALALGPPWHLARLGTWHVTVATVRSWSLPARLVFSLCVLAARVRRTCPPCVSDAWDGTGWDGMGWDGMMG